jgi:DNA-3-methyladenine glycosylase II
MLDALRLQMWEYAAFSETGEDVPSPEIFENYSTSCPQSHGARKTSQTRNLKARTIPRAGGTDLAMAKDSSQPLPPPPERSRRTIVAPGSGRDRWDAAVRHLRRVDQRLRALIERIGPCLLEPREDRFGMLVSSIVAQQISARAATAINLRLHALSGQPHQPERLLELGEDALRGVGLSARKASYVLNLAEAVASGRVPLSAFDETWDDPAIVASLTSIKGIGVWTAEMFLIFALNRPDVLPVHDLGVRAALRDFHALAEMPKPRDCHGFALSWRPYRTIACWYIWQNVDRPAAR